MDFFLKNKKMFSVVFRNSIRLFPSSICLDALGYLPFKKTYIQQGTFDTFNFSLILSGEGIFQYEGSPPVEVVAPCVLTQWPGAKFSYGSTGKDGWEEIYLTYKSKYTKYFEYSDFLNPKRRCWNVQRKSEFHNVCHQLLSCASQGQAPGVADTIDRIAEQVILTSLLLGKPIKDAKNQIILKIKEQVDLDPYKDYDFHEIAAGHGLSISTFRNLWNQYVGMPPQRYAIEQRMKIARQLLLETSKTISEIAWELGYEDVLYFSRLFKKYTGLNATAYRKNMT